MKNTFALERSWSRTQTNFQLENETQILFCALSFLTLWNILNLAYCSIIVVNLILGCCTLNLQFAENKWCQRRVQAAAGRVNAGPNVCHHPRNKSGSLGSLVNVRICSSLNQYEVCILTLTMFLVGQRLASAWLCISVSPALFQMVWVVCAHTLILLGNYHFRILWDQQIKILKCGCDYIEPGCFTTEEIPSIMTDVSKHLNPPAVCCNPGLWKPVHNPDGLWKPAVSLEHWVSVQCMYLGLGGKRHPNTKWGENWRVWQGQMSLSLHLSSVEGSLLAHWWAGVGQVSCRFPRATAPASCVDANVLRVTVSPGGLCEADTWVPSWWLPPRSPWRCL